MALGHTTLTNLTTSLPSPSPFTKKAVFSRLLKLVILDTGMSNVTAAELQCLSLLLCMPHTPAQLGLFHHEILKDYQSPKPVPSLLTCLQAFSNKIYYFLTYICVYLSPKKGLADLHRSYHMSRNTYC